MHTVLGKVHREAGWNALDFNLSLAQSLPVPANLKMQLLYCEKSGISFLAPPASEDTCEAICGGPPPQVSCSREGHQEGELALGP